MPLVFTEYNDNVEVKLVLMSRSFNSSSAVQVQALYFAVYFSAFQKD